MDTAAAPRSVFISYARGDRDIVERIAGRLANAGFRVWWDRKLEGGQAFAAEIERQLTAADVVIVVWSAKSVASDWVRDEAARGRDRHRLVPISIDGSPPPLGFGQYHAIDFSHGRGKARLDELARAIHAATDEAATDSKSPLAGTVSRRRLLAVASAGVLVLSGIAAFVARDMYGNGSDGEPANSIAVLPFANLSGSADQAYFSEGIAAELRSTLQNVAGLQVAAQTSSNAFRGSTETPANIARKLGVAYLLEGTVQRAGEMVRIAADLIDAASGLSRWSQTFDRKFTDIFAIQSDVAQNVASSLALTLNASAKHGSGTSNPAAYDAYLRGRALFNLGGDEATYRAALAQFDASIARDQGYAASHAARSRTLAAIANQFATGSQHRPLYDAAIASAHRAVALAPELADAQSALGYALFNGRLDVRGARGPYERSRRLGHGDADVLIRYALYAARTGEAAEAEKVVARAATLDPLNPRVFRAQGSVYYAAREFAASIPPMQRALTLNPTISVARSGIGDALLMLGKPKDARSSYQAEPLSLFRLTGLAIVEHRLGDEQAARAALAQLVAENGDNALYQQAQVQAQWGQSTAALDLLERARATGDAGLIYLRNDPFVDSLRREPRFRHLMTQIGFA